MKVVAHHLTLSSRGGEVGDVAGWLPDRTPVMAPFSPPLHYNTSHLLPPCPGWAVLLVTAVTLGTTCWCGSVQCPCTVQWSKIWRGSLSVVNLRLLLRATACSASVDCHRVDRARSSCRSGECRAENQHR